MKQYKDQERQQSTSNGYANDTDTDLGAKVESRVMEMASMASPELRGYLMLGGGLVLLAHTLGYFPLLNWALMAVSIAAIFYGANSSHVWGRMKQMATYLRNISSSN